MVNADDMDATTPDERKKLVGYCEKDEQWYKFILGEDDGFCPICGGKPSQQIGFQIISQKTFFPDIQGKKKIKKNLR